MKRTQLRRRTPIARSRRRIPRTAKRRGGLSRAERLELKQLHRTVVMLRAGAFRFDTPSGESWKGPCARCSKVRWLQVCHIMSQGKYKASAYDPDNAFAGCWYCHLGPGSWHKDPIAAAEWILGLLGSFYPLLRMRCEAKKSIDFMAEKLALQQEIARLTKF